MTSLTQSFEIVESPASEAWFIPRASQKCPCPWCVEPTDVGYGSWHSACTTAYVNSPAMLRWAASWRKGHDTCGLCGGNARTCRC